MLTEQNNKQKTNWFVLLIVLLTTFIPSSGSMGALKMGIIVALCLIRASERNSDPYVTANRSKAQKIILLWFLSIFLAAGAVLLTEYGLDYNLIGHEITRVIYYLALIILCFNITISLKQLFIACSIIIIIHCTIQITQYYKLGIFDEYIIKYYMEKTEGPNWHYLATKQLYGAAFRSGSIFINANVYVCYPYLSLGVFLQYYRRTKGYLPMAMIAVAFYSVILTGSRMGLITCIFILAWFLWYSKKNTAEKQSGKSLIVIIGALIVAIVCFDSIAEYSKDMRAFRLDDAYEGSGSTKVEGMLWRISASNPLEWIFGSLGAIRLAIAIDMEWGYIMAWFGLFGLFWYLKLIKLVYTYHRKQYPVISTVSAAAIVLTAMGASSVLNMSVFPYICAISFTNILPINK